MSGSFTLSKTSKAIEATLYSVIGKYVINKRFDSQRHLSGTIIRGTLKTPNSQLVTPISTKLQRPDGCD
jgi:hypothetical protein